MPLNPHPIDRIPWMPSPPLVPHETAQERVQETAQEAVQETVDEGFIDAGHLARITLGDAGLQREVLTLFIRQSAELVGRIAALPAETAAIAHTLKGSARGIGAFSAAASAERLEYAAGDRSASIAALAELRDVLSGTVRAIEEMLRH
jgi:HPt (histidine-containing phosphotransfer) domain-containing protein